jgi:hypothetical protein
MWTLELERAVTESARLIREPFIAVDKNHQPVVVYIPRHLSVQTVEETERELIYLQEQYPPPEVDGNEDNRHYRMKRMLDMYPKEKVGRYHFAWWCSIGHPHTEPVLSIYFRGGSGSGNVTKSVTAGKFIKKLAPLCQELSVALATIDFSLWSNCMEMMDKVWRRDPLSCNIKSCGLDAWHGYAILSNVDIHVHMDSSDHKRGWAATTVFGQFEGGDFVVPYLKVKFPFQPGDVLFIRLSDLTHFVTDWSPVEGGERFCIVHFNHEDVIKYMEKIV